MASTNEHGLHRGCLVEGGGFFGRQFMCSNGWAAGRVSKWAAERANGDIDATLVFGATGPEAGTVRISARDAADTIVPAVATPTSSGLRFFATVLPSADARVDSVTPLDANGDPAAPPPGLPWERGECGRTTVDEDGVEHTVVCATTAAADPASNPR